MHQKVIEEIQTVALPEFKNGNIKYGSLLQAVFLLPEEKQLQGEIAAVYTNLLFYISAKKLLQLSERFREHTYDWYMPADCDIWRNAPLTRQDFLHLNLEEYGAMLKIGTFMANGYYREQCIRALDGLDGALPFFILRLNDWVGQIRTEAFKLAEKRIKECGLLELFSSLPALEKLENSGRRNKEQFQYLKTLTADSMVQKFKQLPENMLQQIHCYDINVKNAIYRFSSKNKVLSKEQMEKLISLEKSGYGKTLLVQGIFCHYGYEQADMERFLFSKNAAVRYFALTYRYEREHTAWNGLERMLLDKCRKIRENASYILKKHTNLDILDFYKKKLEIEPSKSVLLGICEQGSRKDIAVIESFLNSQNGQIARAALEAYGKLAGLTGDEIYWKFLFDCRPFMAKEAFQAIKKYGIRYGWRALYKAFLENKGIVRGYILKLLLEEPSWERLPCLLELYESEELSKEENEIVFSGILHRHYYGRISIQQADKIRAILQKSCKIPEYVKRGILFDLKYVIKN